MDCKGEEAPMVDEAVGLLWQYEENLSSSFVSALEKLVQATRRNYVVLPTCTDQYISAIRSKHSSAQERGYRGYTSWGILWFYLCDHGEAMRKWDEKIYIDPEGLSIWFERKNNHKRGFFQEKMLLQFSTGSSPDSIEGLVLFLKFLKRLLIHIYKKWVTNTLTKIREALHPARWKKWDNRVYWTVWIQWPGMSDPQEYKALVDTGVQGALMPSSYNGAEPIWISGVTGGSQELTVWETKVSLTGNEWQKHHIVTSPEAPVHLWHRLPQQRVFQGPKSVPVGFWHSCFEERGH